jgi:DNA repair exonuclease SbcCD ATPase subunit
MTEQNQIADLNTAQGTAVTQPVTPEPSGVANVTPTQPVPDAGSDKLKELEAKIQAREQDINKLKSTYDKQLAQTKKQFEDEQRKLQEEIQKAKLATMTDDQKLQFERQLELEQAQQWKQKALQYEQQMQELEIRNNYTQYFVEQMGVPKEKLKLDGDINALVQSGWEGVQSKVKELEGLVQTLKQPQPSQETTPQQPEVPERSPLTNQINSGAPKISWADIEKRYPNTEEFFTKLEQGTIDPRTIPME